MFYLKKHDYTQEMAYINLKTLAADTDLTAGPLALKVRPTGLWCAKLGLASEASFESGLVASRKDCLARS